MLNVVFERSLRALADLPVRVLLTTGHAVDPESLRPWPDNARVEQWWPQDDVMPLASVMVGHGGFGTTMSALAAGVPQVVVPLFASDQEINATRIAQVGAGIRLDGRQDATEGLADAVSRVLADEGMRAVAGAMADEIASLPEVSQIVEIHRSARIEPLATDEPPPKSSGHFPTVTAGPLDWASRRVALLLDGDGGATSTGLHVECPLLDADDGATRRCRESSGDLLTSGSGHVTLGVDLVAQGDELESVVAQGDVLLGDGLPGRGRHGVAVVVERHEDDERVGRQLELAARPGHRSARAR